MHNTLHAYLHQVLPLLKGQDEAGLLQAGKRPINLDEGFSLHIYRNTDVGVEFVLGPYYCLLGGDGQFFVVFLLQCNFHLSLCRFHQFGHFCLDQAKLMLLFTFINLF